MATIYYSKNIQNKINKGKKHIEQSPEETRCKLPKTLSIEVIWDTNSPAISCDNILNCCLTEKLNKDTV